MEVLLMAAQFCPTQIAYDLLLQLDVSCQAQALIPVPLRNQLSHWQCSQGPSLENDWQASFLSCCKAILQ